MRKSKTSIYILSKIFMFKFKNIFTFRTLSIFKTIIRISKTNYVTIFHVFRMRRIKFKIINMIVASIPINMMDFLSIKKTATYCFFHNNPMLSNVARFISGRMIRTFQFNISSVFSKASFPRRAFFKNKFASESFSNFIFSIFRTIFSFPITDFSFFRLPITLIGAKFRIILFKRFFTYWADFCFHNIFSFFQYNNMVMTLSQSKYLMGVTI